MDKSPYQVERESKRTKSKVTRTKPYGHVSVFWFSAGESAPSLPFSFEPTRLPVVSQRILPKEKETNLKLKFNLNLSIFGICIETKTIPNLGT